MNAAVPAEEVRTTGTADRLWPAVLAVRRLLSWTVLAGPAPPLRTKPSASGATWTPWPVRRPRDCPARPPCARPFPDHHR